MDEKSLQKFHKKFQPFIKLLVNEKFGFGVGNVVITDISSGRPIGDSVQNECDRFKICIPYAGHHIEWYMFFNSFHPEFAPDFLFDDDTFLADPDLEFVANNIPSFVKWNPEDPQSLLNVVREILSLYRKHQINLLDDLDYSRLQFEYSSLIHQAQVDESDVEVLVGYRTKLHSYSNAVIFLIRLTIDLSGLPVTMNNVEDPAENAILLLVTFHSPEGSRITPQLLLSPYVEQALGPIHLPSFPPGGSCLMDYVPVVRQLLSDRIDAVSTSYERRQELFMELFKLFCSSIVEYDAATYLRVTFLFERHDFYFLLHIVLPSNFPLDRPVLVFQSVYHSVNGRPYKTRCDDFPYHSKWEPSKMVRKAYVHILSFVELFKKNSIQCCQN